MVKEAFGTEEEESDSSLAPGKMFMMAIATSIDALAVGVTFAFLKVNIPFSPYFLALGGLVLFFAYDFLLEYAGMYFMNLLSKIQR